MLSCIEDPFVSFIETHHTHTHTTTTTTTTHNLLAFPRLDRMSCL